VPPDRRPRLNVLTVDVEEYYHGVEFTRALGPEALGRLPSRVVAATDRLLDLLDRHRARATFFTLGVVAERHPGLVRRIVARGHELASHGWDHTPVFAQDPAAFRRDVRRARQALEQAGSRRVVGYRAPNYSIRPDTPWAFPTLREEGYRYDSSIHPIAHDRYSFPDAPRFPHPLPGVDGGELWEVPVGTARLAGTNVPLGGGFFRLFPLEWIRAAIGSVNREGWPVVLYVHPWELDPGQPRVPMPWHHRVRHYVGLERAEAKLTALLETYPFTSIADAFGAIFAAQPAAA
jgi:polysaccharide deacetylase family protein (PEP-CTERM system associated)